MKIACIGDLHGMNRWKEVFELDVDHYVFMGDYVDSFDLSDDEILDNLNEVFEFKLSHPEAVTLLLGNHDIQYLFYPYFRCTGFRKAMQGSLTYMFIKNLSLFKVACYFDNYIFSHAGLCATWVKKHIGGKPEIDVLVNRLNEMINEKASIDSLASIGSSRGGDQSHGGPFWCDFDHELVQDPLIGVNQVVGHSRTTFLNRKTIAGDTILNVDYLAYSEEAIFILEV